MFVSYAQNFEDVILNRVFNDKESGFYIDVGAHHPVYDSVTKAFYDRGWRGINIEPVREFFDLLQQDRPNDINLPLAVGEQAAKLEFFELQGSGFSTFDGDTAIKLATDRNLTLSRYEIPVRPLAEICREYVCVPIDFLKIDVEGWEEQVLAGNDWEAFRPTVILVEATLPNSPSRRETNIPYFLQEKGYRLVYFDGLNDYYLAEEAKEINSHFQTPPNVFDNFTLFKVTDLTSHATNLNQLIQARNQEITILTHALEDERFETQRLSQALKKLKRLKDEPLGYCQSQIGELQILLTQSHHQITSLQAELNQSNERIAAMETSKFWKLRYLWFRLKQRLGLPEN